MTNSIVKSKKEEVIQLLLNQDQNGIRLLSDQYSGYLLIFIKRCIKREEISRLILENTFRKIKNTIDKFDRKREVFLRWIARIALEESIDHIKEERSLSSQRAMNFHK